MIHKEGIGWRLVIDHSKKDFPILIGGDCYSVQLSLNEWNSLGPLIFDLIDQFKSYKNKYTTDESIILELEKDPWRACIEGIDEDWSLKLTLSGDYLKVRGFEMYWPMPSAEAFVSAMRTMWDSYQ